MGVSVAYFSSIALLGMAASETRSMDGMGETTTYFDTVVLLTMFLLAGRYLEAYSKTRTADAITALGKLRPTEAIVVEPATEKDTESKASYAQPETDLEKGDPELPDNMPVVSEKQEHHSRAANTGIYKVPVDQLEVGDVVRVPHGASPPADGIIVTQTGSLFDESSLTGESRPVKKDYGEKVFVGTMNRGGVVDVRIVALGGETM